MYLLRPDWGAHPVILAFGVHTQEDQQFMVILWAYYNFRSSNLNYVRLCETLSSNE